MRQLAAERTITFTTTDEYTCLFALNLEHRFQSTGNFILLRT
jgi:hypothetical protein